MILFQFWSLFVEFNLNTKRIQTHMKSQILVAILLMTTLAIFSQKVSVTSPNQKVIVELYNTQNAESGQWYLKVKYSIKEKTSEVIHQISLGLNRADQSFSKELKFLKVSKPT